MLSWLGWFCVRRESQAIHRPTPQSYSRKEAGCKICGVGRCIFLCVSCKVLDEYNSLLHSVLSNVLLPVVRKEGRKEWGRQPALPCTCCS